MLLAPVESLQWVVSDGQLQTALVWSRVVEDYRRLAGLHNARHSCPCPGMVTCELSHVCWLRRNQHNTQHMQITRKREKLVKSRTRPSAPFPKGLLEKSAR